MITLLKTESPKPKQIHIDTRKVIGLNSTPYVNVDVAQIGERVIRVKDSKICVIISQKTIEKQVLELKKIVESVETDKTTQDAECLLGICISLGIGIAQDLKQAQLLFLKAIEEISFEELQQTMKELLDLASNVVDLKRFNKEPVVSSTT